MTGAVAFMRFAMERRVPWRLVDPAVPKGAAKPADLDELLKQVGAGDHAAFTRLYDAVAGTAFGMIKRTLRDHAMSEEVLQEVMVDVWRQSPRYDPNRGSAVAWILTMTHRRAVDRVRSEQSNRDRVDKVAARGAAMDHDSVYETAIQTEIGHEVRAALATLSKVQRQAIEMAYYDGLTQNEIATRLDIPIGTVKTRIRDGMVRLRETLGNTA